MRAPIKTLTRVIPPYEYDKKGFKKAMEALATDLEKDDL